MAPNTHSILGASSAHRWLNCPGSVRLSAGLPKRSSSYAEEGTAAHELAELCLRKGEVPRAHIGTFITVGETAYEVTDEMAEAVQVYLDIVTEDFEVGYDIEIEKKFHLDWLYPGLFGTNDALVGEPFGTLRVYDYKHGAGVAVDATDNPQLMYYALGACHGEAYEEVELVIVQPRAQHPDGPVRRCRMSVDELMRWGQEVLKPGAEATEDPAAPVVAGDHCKFCPALAICPAQMEMAMTVAKEAFSQAQPPAPAGLDPEELKRILDAAPMVEAWLDACRDHVRLLLEQGADPKALGYKLVAGRASRKWVGEKDATAMMEMLGIDPFERKLKSPAQAEKEAKKGAFDALITTSRGVQLAPLSDKREAISGQAAIAFGEVEL